MGKHRKFNLDELKGWIDGLYADEDGNVTIKQVNECLTMSDVSFMDRFYKKNN